MATACGDFLRRLNDSVACPVCFMILDKPRSLSCGHTFCRSCIERVCDQRKSDYYDVEEYEYDYNSVGDMRCPVCRQPIQTRVEALPVNFAVQNMISDLLQSSEGICRACYDDRKLELATVQCRDCRETFCDVCSTQHSDMTHRLESLFEKKCDTHQRKLELYCFQCLSNICVMCFSEDHQGHKCHAISKVAEELTENLQQDVKKLSSCESRLQQVLDVLMSQKQKYERYFWSMEQRVKAENHGRRFRASLETFKLEKRRRVVDGFIKTKLKAINAIIQRNDSGKHIDHGQARHVLQDVGVVLYVLIADLGDHVASLNKYVSDMVRLERKAAAILDSCSSSAYDVTENTNTIVPLHGQIVASLEDISNEEDPHRVFIGTGSTTVPILSSEGHEEVAELLKQATVLRELLTYEEIPALSTRRAGLFGKIFRKKKERQSQERHRQEERLRGAQEANENLYDQLTKGQRPPTVSPEPPPKPVQREKEKERQQREKQEHSVPVAPTTTMSPLMEELRLRLAQRATQITAGQATSDNERYTTSLQAGARAALPAHHDDDDDDDDEIYRIPYLYVVRQNFASTRTMLVDELDLLRATQSQADSSTVGQTAPDTTTSITESDNVPTAPPAPEDIYDDDDYGSLPFTNDYGPLPFTNVSVESDDDLDDDLDNVTPDEDYLRPNTIYQNLPPLRDTHDSNTEDTYQPLPFRNVSNEHDVSGDETANVANGLEVMAVYDFLAAEDDEISLHIGDIITNVHEDNGWLYGTAPDGSQGLFPSCFVRYMLAA